MKNKNKRNIVVITCPYSSNDVVGKTILENLIKILNPLSNEIFIINGLLPKSSDKKIHLINGGTSDEGKRILLRIFDFLLIGPRTSINLFKISKNIDIVIFFIGAAVYPLCMLSAKLMKKKTVIVVSGSVSKSVEKISSKRLFGYGGIFHGHIYGILEKVNYVLSDRIVVYSEGLINQLELNNYKSKISSNGARFIDFNHFKITRNSRERRDLIGYIGRLSGEKGVLNFVKTIPKILEERYEIKFLIGGDGYLRDKIEEYLDENNLNNKVELVGWISHDKIPDYLNKLKLLVLPSYTEGLPNIMLEAMACETPVLATPVGAIPDIIKNGENGFIMEDNSPECIAENVIRALNYPNLDEIVKNARKLVEEKFTYEAAAKRY